ncbi:MAG: recombinase family protein [Ruminococcus sp.]|nr:recombinase family protein [Ruminococcus sp.]
MYQYQLNQPMQLRTYNAALYIRLSREDGDKPESDSVVNQKRILENFVNSQPDIELADTYVDDGYSGATFDRPAFLRMMADVYAGKVNCVIVKDSSRFGRNASESGRYIGEIFPKLRVRYIAVNDLIDSGKSQGAAVDFLNNTMRGMINEYYVAANSESIRSTLNMERRRGEFIGSFAKYGYKKDPADHHKLVIDEEAAEIVRQIYRMYLSGTGIRGIVRHLNESGVPNPSTYKRNQGMNFKARTVGDSSLWSDKTARRTLQDQMYIGNMVQGKCRKINYKTKSIRSCTPDEWIIVEGTHEPIIDKDDFERVQKMLNKGVKGAVQSGNIDLFAGLLKCADCGHALIKKTNKNPDKTYVYYRCSTHCKCKTACAAHTIRFERLYHCVLYCIQQMVDIAVDADKVLPQMKENQLTSTNEGLKKQLEKQEKDLEKVIQRMAELYPDFKDGTINADQYRINKAKYEQAQKELTQSINRLRSSLGKSDTDSAVTNDFIEHFKRHGNIDRLTRPLLTELIDQIAVHQDGTLDITFNFCDTFTTARHLLNTKAS